jgi:hypothetical protein
MKITKVIKDTLTMIGLIVMVAVLVTQSAPLGIGTASMAEAAGLAAAPVVYWSHEARKAITPAGPGGIFGAENYGNKSPGDSLVYMAIVQVAVYDAALAFEGGYQPYAIDLTAPAGASPEAAIATAAHHTLLGLQPYLGLTPAQEAILDGRYTAYLAAIPDGTAKANGIEVGQQAANAVLALRVNDGREANPQYGQPPFVPPPAGPGVWDRGSAPAVGLLLPGMRPLALQTSSQFRPDGPNPPTSREYAEDFRQVKKLGRFDSAARTAEQTSAALFWTDHNLRQWNDALLGLAAAHGLDMVQTARMLAMAHVAGADAIIACFEAKYHYWSWRPYQAIPRAGTDGNPATDPDPTWTPLRATPNHPEYPSGHATHTSAVVEALQEFFGTDRVAISLDSRITGTTRSYSRLKDVVKEINQARVWSGFHFRNSDQEGANLGRRVSRYVLGNLFQPVP